MKQLLLILILLITTNGFSQSNINDYKYVIVQKQFHFQGEPDQFNLNQLTKFLFKKYGFETYIEGETLPEELINKYCLGLKAEVISKGTFKTKTQVKLIDCNNDIIFSTNEVISKEKDFKRLYNLSIRKALESLNQINYKYVPNDKFKSKETEEIEKLKAEVETLKKNKEDTTKNNTDEIIANTKEVVANVAKNVKEISKKETTFSDYLKAHATKNGFIIKDASNKNVLFKLIKANKESVYLVTNNKGIVYKNGNDVWVREYIVNDKIIFEVLKIKFQ
jgi:hypothetical protein